MCTYVLNRRRKKQWQQLKNLVSFIKQNTHTSSKTAAVNVSWIDYFLLLSPTYIGTWCKLPSSLKDSKKKPSSNPEKIELWRSSKFERSVT
jgi:hypothetical protein